MKSLSLLVVLATVVAAFSVGRTPLAAQPATSCAQAPYHQFDFWLGTWTVRNGSGKVLGRNEITREQNGCVVLERWSGLSGVRGSSVNAFDAKSGHWRETWVDSTGGLMLLSGSATATGMRMAGEAPDARFGTVRNRIEWIRLSNGVVRQHVSESDDGGRTWNDVFDGYSTRELATQTVAHEVLTQSMPRMNGDELTLHVVDVTYPPGGSSTPHSHPCPVSVYVTSGSLRERIDDGTTRVFTAGQSFYEPPNHLHAVSANASAQEPARFIASFVCDKQTELSTKVHQ